MLISNIISLCLLLILSTSCTLQKNDGQKSNSDKQKKQGSAQDKSKYDDPPSVATFGSTTEGTTESVGNVSGSATGGVPFKQADQSKSGGKKSSNQKADNASKDGSSQQGKSK